MDPQLLSQLKDIHLPSNAGIWPLAIGWWILAALVLMILLSLVYGIRRFIKIRKHKRILFTELAVLEDKLQRAPSKNAIAETNILLRRMALAYCPEKNIASLTGSDWLTFLDESGKTQKFSQGAGRILIEAPYGSGDLDSYNYTADEFIPLIRDWVKQIAHKVGGCL